jgi:LemA protein
MITALVIIGIIVLIVIVAISMYNNLVRLRNVFKNAFAQIDVQLKRRYDLIPNLVETAKGYLKHERETLEAVIAARNSAVSANAGAAALPGDPKSMQALITAESGLTGAAWKAFRPIGILPGPQGQPDHGAAHGGALLDRKQDLVFASGV